MDCLFSSQKKNKVNYISKKQAQISMEFLLIITFSLLLVSIAIGFFISYSNGVIGNVEEKYLTENFDLITNKISNMFYLEAGNERLMKTKFPDNIENITIFHVENKTIDGEKISFDYFEIKYTSKGEVKEQVFYADKKEIRFNCSINCTTVNADVLFLRHYDFDGVDDYVNIGNVTELSFERNESFSMSVWIKLDSYGTNYPIFANHGNSPKYIGYSFGITDSGNLFTKLIGDKSINNFIEVESSTTIELDKWNLVVFTYNGGSDTNSVNFFINGQMNSTNSIRNSLSSSIVNLSNSTIGKSYLDGYLKSKLSDLRVFNKVLSPSEVQEIYGHSFTTAVSNLVCSYKADEFEGAVSFDNSTNQLLGQINLGTGGNTELSLFHVGHEEGVKTSTSWDDLTKFQGGDKKIYLTSYGTWVGVDFID